MVDEAHAIGLFGAKRRGLAEAYEIAERVEVQMGTLGKAVGSSGGFICGSRTLIDFLINRGRSFIFSTAPVPGAAASARAGLDLIQSAEGGERRVRVWSLVDQLKNALTGTDWKLPVVQSAIVPLFIGDERRASDLANALREHGIFIPAVRYPTVARGKARLRVTLTAAHSPADVSVLADALIESGAFRF
jgi:7-keto-8-aminopelargonate synthetase-like enzyme